MPHAEGRRGDNEGPLIDVRLVLSGEQFWEQPRQPPGPRNRPEAAMGVEPQGPGGST